MVFHWVIKQNLKDLALWQSEPLNTHQVPYLQTSCHGNGDLLDSKQSQVLLLELNPIVLGHPVDVGVG